jgi:hypothetical protein
MSVLLLGFIGSFHVPVMRGEKQLIERYIFLYPSIYIESYRDKFMEAARTLTREEIGKRVRGAAR